MGFPFGFLPHDCFGLGLLFEPEQHALYPPIRLLNQGRIGNVEEVAQVDLNELVGDRLVAGVMELEEFQL